MSKTPVKSVFVCEFDGLTWRGILILNSPMEPKGGTTDSPTRHFCGGEAPKIKTN